MSKYLYDTEFIEGAQYKRFLGIKTWRKTKPTIDLISIGIISEDGREYYSVSKDFNLKEAWNRHDLKINKHYPSGPEYIKEYWIRENVLKPIYDEWISEYNGKIIRLDIPVELISHDTFSYSAFKNLLKIKGKSNKEIAEDIINFTREGVKGIDTKAPNLLWPGGQLQVADGKVELYAYYGAYDHVALCWLFGKMIDLPEGFPMYTRDLKQMLDEKSDGVTNDQMKKWFGYPSYANIQDPSFKEKLTFIKNMPKYPRCSNEHSAIHDARWSKRLYEFLNKI